MQVVLVLVVVGLVWFGLISPLLEQVRTTTPLDEKAKRVGLRAIMEFCRPHTVKGTLLASLSGYVLLSVYNGGVHAFQALGLVLVSGVNANIFIVGINQLVDVESDRINKKKLPVAEGSLSWNAGERIVGVSLVLGVGLAFLQSELWGSVISCMCLIGFVYSVPPFRLKRFAVPAALCIVSARAVLGTVGGALTYADAMGRPLDDFALRQLLIFTSVMVVFTTVIALMKDVPDIAGDARDGVRSFSVTKGADWVMHICFRMIAGAYIGVMVVSAVWLRDFACGVFHAMALVWLVGRSVTGTDKSSAIHNYLHVIWPLFYAEFPAYLIPIMLGKLGLVLPGWLLMAVLGAEVAYIRFYPPKIYHAVSATSRELARRIQSKSGIDVQSLHRNLSLPGPDPTTMCAEPGCSLIDEAAVEMSVALCMHAKLTRLVGKKFTNAKKLAILAGDWLLAKAVIALCESDDQTAVHAMGQSIAQATQAPEKDMAEVILGRAKHHKRHLETRS